jgi:hypothetical protein
VSQNGALERQTITKKKRVTENPPQKSKITSRYPHRKGSVQREFHGMPVGRHETLAVRRSYFSVVLKMANHHCRLLILIYI